VASLDQLMIDSKGQVVQMISWRVGNRDAVYAKAFIEDVASHLKNRVQLTTDGLKTYIDAIDQTFGTEIDFAQLVKTYGNAIEGEHRYSPAECTGAYKQVITVDPKMKHVSTSYLKDKT
jgi:transposase-like protein